VTAKRFEYAVSVEADGAMLADGAARLEVPSEWTPEHLVLAGLARCTLASLAYYAERASIAMRGAATASGTVGRRDDGVYAFVDVACRINVQLEPGPGDVAGLLARAEGGCFIGSSLVLKPRYDWIVNGEPA
jgi:organic hydroperoxide reductase OsmC/OhrA